MNAVVVIYLHSQHGSLIKDAIQFVKLILIINAEKNAQ